MSVYSFSHLIEPWVLPPGFNCLVIILGIIACFFWRKIGMLLIIVGTGTLWLLSAPIFVYSMINLLQNQYPLLQEKELAHPRSNFAIVVLGGGDALQVEYGMKRTVSDFTAHRVKYAAYLHQKMHLPILLSGGKSHADLDSEATLMANQLRDEFNINADYLETQSLNTADESRLILPILKQHQLDGVYLVTNAWHMPRSVFIFQCAGIKVIPAPMGYYVYGPGYALISYLPNMQALYASSIALHEWIGLLWYHFRYGHTCSR